MDCRKSFADLYHSVRAAPSPYAERHLADLLRRIAAYETDCDQDGARFLRLRLEYSEGAATSNRLIQLAETLGSSDTTPPHVRMVALNTCAGLTHKRPGYTRAQNLSYRAEALALARRTGDRQAELIIQDNWLFSCVNLGEVDAANAKVEEIRLGFQDMLDAPPSAELSAAPVNEVAARFLSHKAKLCYMQATANHDVASRSQLASDGANYYELAIARVGDDDHARVNLRIEFAEQLLNAPIEPFSQRIKDVKGHLDTAYRALDAHNCNPCCAYYWQTMASLENAEAFATLNEDREKALTLWQSALRSSERSVSLYSAVNHQYAEDAATLRDQIKVELSMASQPMRIYQCHKKPDVERVKRFDRVLQTLGFDTWLDESELTAGRRLDAMKEGMAASCACVFYVTEGFTDSGFVADEISYALNEEEHRGPAHFRLVIIAMDPSSTVPARLAKNHNYRRTASELDALDKLLKALPVRVGTVYWIREHAKT